MADRDLDRGLNDHEPVDFGHHKAGGVIFASAMCWRCAHFGWAHGENPEQVAALAAGYLNQFPCVPDASAGEFPWGGGE